MTYDDDTTDTFSGAEALEVLQLSCVADLSAIAKVMENRIAEDTHHPVPDAPGTNKATKPKPAPKAKHS